MIDKKRISDAFDAHNKWKLRLAECVSKEGKCNCSIEEIGNERVCEFGKWLYSPGVSKQDDDFYRSVEPLHRDFHKEAAKVLRYAKLRNKQKVEESMGSLGSYTVASHLLFNELLRWEKKNSAVSQFMV